MQAFRVHAIDARRYKLCLLVSLYVLFTSCCHLSDTLFRLFVVFNTETNWFHSENYGCEHICWLFILMVKFIYLPYLSQVFVTPFYCWYVACSCICKCSTELCLLTMVFQKVPGPVSKISCTAMRIKRSQAWHVGFHPCPWHAEIFLNLLTLLYNVDGGVPHIFNETMF